MVPQFNEPLPRDIDAPPDVRSAPDFRQGIAGFPDIQ